MFFHTRPPGHAILQEHSRHADRVQPLADFCALQVEREDVVTTTRTHEHGRSGVLLGRWRVNRQRRIRHITQPHHRFSGDQFVRGLGVVRFRRQSLRFIRSPSGPQRNRLRNGTPRRASEQQEDTERTKKTAKLHGGDQGNRNAELASNQSPFSHHRNPNLTNAGLCSPTGRIQGFPPRPAHTAPDSPTSGHSCSESSSAWGTPPAAPSARQSNTPISTKRGFSPATRDRAHSSARPVRSREPQRVAFFPARGRHLSFDHRNPNVRASRVASCSFVTLPW